MEVTQIIADHSFDKLHFEEEQINGAAIVKIRGPGMVAFQMGDTVMMQSKMGDTFLNQ